MTSDDLRRLADQEESIPYQAEYRTCDYVIDAIREAADEIDRLNARATSLEAFARELYGEFGAFLLCNARVYHGSSIAERATELIAKARELGIEE